MTFIKNYRIYLFIFAMLERYVKMNLAVYKIAIKKNAVR